MVWKVVPVVFCFIHLLARCYGLALLVEPPQRSSLWRVGYNTPVNMQDNQLNCGGFDYLWSNSGMCGLCGDPYQGPRLHESGNKYASGIVARNYTWHSNGTNIPVSLNIEKNTLGFFEFQICKDSTEDESCFSADIEFVESESSRFYPGSLGGTFNLHIIIPSHVKCSHCILRWKYTTGYRKENECLGHGNQEIYINCADIGIVDRGGDITVNSDNEVDSRIVVGTGTQTNQEVEVIAPDNGNVITLEGGIQIIAPKSVPEGGNPVHMNGMLCYAPPTTKAPPTTTPGPCLPTNDTFECHGSNHYKFIQGIGDWCVDNCRQGNCEPLVCECSCGSNNVYNNPQAGVPEGVFCRSLGFLFSDEWCRRNCKHGICPMSQCSPECLTLDAMREF